MKKDKKPGKLRGNGLNKVFIDFSNVAHLTLGEIYGTEPIPLTAITKKLWALINSQQLKKS